MNESIATPCEDLKNHAFMHHIESNFKRIKKLSLHNHLAILTDVTKLYWLVHCIHAGL
jgi:hypothetical protein